MAVLRLRGQSLSVLISALYLTEDDPALELELAREDVFAPQVVLQGSDTLTSLMWKVVDPLLTHEWDAFRVAFDGVTQKFPGRVALLDSAQALIELDSRRSVRVVEAAAWQDQASPVWLPNLEDPRLEAKIVTAGSVAELREPVVADVSTDDPPGFYSQYVPIGRSSTLFTKHGSGRVIDAKNLPEFASTLLSRLQTVERFLLDIA
jgi:hypothetical protein